MAERTNPSQSPQAQETREPLTSTPSPYEAAFDAEIKTRFGSGLLEPFLDKYGRLIRLSSPVSINENTVVFQYTRWDVEKRDSQALAMAYREMNKPEGSDSSGQKEKTGDDDQDEEATFNRQYSEKREAVATIKQRLEMAGGHDPKRAVTDPEYYVEGTKITQWPESFEFAIFQKDNDPFSGNPEPSQLERRGKVNGIRPDYLGTLSFGVEFEGIRGIVHLRDDDNNLLLTRPRAFYESAAAMAAVYDPRRLEERDDGIEIDDMSHRGKWFMDHPVYPNWISGTPEKTMGDIGSLVSYLTKK